MPTVQTRSKYISMLAFAALLLASLACTAAFVRESIADLRGYDSLEHLNYVECLDRDSTFQLQPGTPPDIDSIREACSESTGYIPPGEIGWDPPEYVEPEDGEEAAVPDLGTTNNDEQNGDEAEEQKETTIIAQINLNSTSDWMALPVASGGSYGSVELLSSSGTVTFAGLSDGVLALNQPLDLGRAGETVDALFRVEFTGVDPDGVIRFYLQKGDYGTSRATFYSELQGVSSLINEFLQPGMTDHPLNQMAFEIPIQAFIAHRAP